MAELKKRFTLLKKMNWLKPKPAFYRKSRILRERETVGLNH